jgi:rhamnosyl/mannosyltransferase
MNVLQLGKYYYPYMGGIENHLYLLCNELKQKVDLDVLVCNSERTSTVEEVDGVRVTRCFELTNVASTSICPTMPLELSRRRYDLVHFHFPHPMAVLSYLLARPAHAHSVVITYHSDILKQKRLLRVYRSFMDRVLERADAIVCTSPNYLEGSDALRPHRDKCTVIPYGIDRSQFERTRELEEQAAAIRARYPGRRLVLGVGRLIYYKGFEYVIRAMRDVDADLLLVGSGPLRPALEKAAHEAGVAQRVHFVGEVHNQALAPYYFASEVYALPSIARSEAFAIVQLEAMACDLPVVNTAIPRSGVSFVSRDGESGLTVPPEDAAAFAGALKTILGDENLARRFGAAGRARVQREFSKEVMTERMLALYAETQAKRERHASDRRSGAARPPEPAALDS